jgi:hypothetical protein
MSSQCRCINPDGGGTVCPPQHIALCIRGADMQCYGECTPIPALFDSITRDFAEWVNFSIYTTVNQYAVNTYDKGEQLIPTLDLVNDLFSFSGQRVYQYGNSRIDVRFSFSFYNEEGSLRRQF